MHADGRCIYVTELKTLVDILGEWNSGGMHRSVVVALSVGAEIEEWGGRITRLELEEIPQEMNRAQVSACNPKDKGKSLSAFFRFLVLQRENGMG